MTDSKCSPNETPHDALSSLAHLLRVRPEFQDICRFGGDWESRHDAAQPGWAYFHIVVRGQCLIDRPGHAVMRLEAGDILLLPHGSAHVTRGSIGVGHASPPIATEYHNGICIKTSIGVEVTTELICGRLHFEQASEPLLIAALPDVVVVSTENRLVMDRFCTLVQWIREELDGASPGALAIATDLANAIFMLMLRQYLASDPPVAGLLALLGKRATAQAVVAMLRDPSHEWTLDELAALAATSRATLVRSFCRIARVPPLTFLTELRLAFARRRLATTGDPIAEIAASVGYQCEAALSRAFHRRFGVRPGKFRIDAMSSRAPTQAALDRSARARQRRGRLPNEDAIAPDGLR
ncbi:AraC family transcriptional regulator [Bradyrhizobium sp. Ai1a-2]|uniref:AraC family transcriptional regulator n=1 Tax=Bradyrhizobium sp. Ai1a-2 TaxID=196490 RepID=UPI00040D818E|nr:AraC family transcriptional regulator [Bradyrhizobium sp. Ai1a-2]